MPLEHNILDTGELNRTENKDPLNEYLAKKSMRFLNLIIDSSVLYGLIMLVDFGMRTMYDLENFILGIGILLISLYFPLLEYFYGKTTGKMITRTTVIGEDGSKVTLSQTISRAFIRSAPIDVLSFLGSNPSGFHDRASKTRVVKDKFFDHREKYYH